MMLPTMMRIIYPIVGLLALAVSIEAQYQPEVTVVTTVMITDPSPTSNTNFENYSPPNNQNPSPALTTASGSTGTSAPSTPGNGAWCVDFTSSDPSFMWAYDGAWGSVTDTHAFGDQNPSSCLSGSGAMYVGTSGLSGGTKFECTFLTDQANCDVSIVDGYSLSMSCSVPQANWQAGPNPIGGTTDLFTKGSCPSGVSNGICPNPNGHDQAQPPGSSVNAFFTDEAFWYNDFVSEQVQYTGNPHMTCTVSGSSGASSKIKREANETEVSELKIREAMDMEVFGIRSGAHKGRWHARELRNFARGSKIRG